MSERKRGRVCNRERARGEERERERRMCKLFCCNFEIKELLLCAGFYYVHRIVCVIDYI